MLRIKIKTKDARFTIPIPYAALHLGISILTSKRFQQYMNKKIKKQEEDNQDKKITFTFPPIDKKLLKPVIKELKKHKGLVLVDVTASDGTEVLVKL
ncbi:hypothetical protein F9U64_11810 [Gracilibacillus oryzae]|uniref:Uncharacterized protein n=1 Tax=Gracilibacillus oryzae TaxID=1672701 RepID=A0A7C8KXV2_9BACI|nr:hypothetical protein [Gracilibacillus oryzae]KAB8133591.1 hypothetical protein F9U64_11810 [Gracilibacillus oryzae]